MDYQSALDLGVPLSLVTGQYLLTLHLYIQKKKRRCFCASKVLPKPATFKFEGDKAESKRFVKPFTSQKSFHTHRFRTIAWLLKKITGTCHLRTSHLSGVMAVSSVLVSCKRLQIPTVMQTQTFSWMIRWMSLPESTNKQFVIS